MNLESFLEILKSAKDFMEKSIEDCHDGGPVVADVVNIWIDKKVQMDIIIEIIANAGFASSLEKKGKEKNIFNIAPRIKGQGFRRQTAAEKLCEFLKSCGYEVSVKRIMD